MLQLRYKKGQKMATQTQTPPSAELAPLPAPEVPAAIEAPKSTELVVPPSREVAQHQLEQDGITAAGYEVALRAPSEVATRPPGEIVPFEDRLPAIREGMAAIEAVHGEDSAEVAELLEEHGVLVRPEQNLREVAVEGEPVASEEDKLLLIEGSEEIYAVQIGGETHRMGIVELFNYLVSIKDSLPGVSVVDSKGNVLMRANGEIAEAIAEDLRSTVIGRLLLKLLQINVVTQSSRVEYSGPVVVAQEASMPVEMTEAETAPPVDDSVASISAALAADPPKLRHPDNRKTNDSSDISESSQAAPETQSTATAESNSNESAATSSEAPGTEMATYDPAAAEANATTNTSEGTPQSEAGSTEQPIVEAGPMAIESAEAAAAERLFDEALAQAQASENWDPSYIERVAGTARKNLAKQEGIHDSRDEAAARRAYDAVDAKVQAFRKEYL